MEPAKLAQRKNLSFTPRTFSDTADSPYAREIDTLATYFILNSAAGAFQPGTDITRGEFSSLVANALDLPIPTKAPKFSDVSADDPHAADIVAMTDLGFLSGQGDGTFLPDAPMTVEEAVTVLSRVAAWASMDGWDLDHSPLLPEEWLNYLDWSDWAQAPARNLIALDVSLEGFTPSANLTREEAAGLLCRLMENIHLIWD